MACTCGHSIEEHGHDPRYPGSTACTYSGCDCIAYEEDEDEEDEPIGTLYHDVVCATCGQERTFEGHDPCIADLPGVAYACCGHGITPGYIAFKNGVTIRFVPTRIEKHRSVGNYVRENQLYQIVFDWSRRT